MWAIIAIIDIYHPYEGEKGDSIRLYSCVFGMHVHYIQK